MKFLKKAMCLFIAMLMICSLCACGSSSSASDEKKIETSNQAINAVKESGMGIDQKIARILDFTEFYDPDYGTTTASQNSDGSWTVVLKGSMMGYVDEYKSDLKSYKFEVKATVTETGEVTSFVEKVN